MLCCSTTAPEFSVEIARVGAERETVWGEVGIPGTLHPTPERASETGCGWPGSVEVEVPVDWRSGYYEVMFRGRDPRSGSTEEGSAFFVVRRAPAVPSAPALLVLATNTYNAYNDWGGPNLYTGAVRVSFDRPMAAGFLRKPEPHMRYPNVDDVEDPGHERFRSWADQRGFSRWCGSAGWHNWERPFVQWAEREGYAIDVATDHDLIEHPEVVNGYHLLLSVGHDEYWSWEMRDTVESFVAAGGNVAFFSGNAVFWQVRFEDAGQTMVCYKHDVEGDPMFHTHERHLTSTMWSSPHVGRPENLLTGVSFCRGGYIRVGMAVPHSSGGYTVWRPQHWVFSGTDLHYGDLFGTKDCVAVYEVDGCDLELSPADGLPVATGSDGTPRDFTILATTPARLWSAAELPSLYRPDEEGDLELTARVLFGAASNETVAKLSHNHAVMGLHTPGGTVFTVGVTDWAYGLSARDPVVTQITRNVLARLTAEPAAGPESPV